MKFILIILIIFLLMQNPAIKKQVMYYVNSITKTLNVKMPSTSGSSSSFSTTNKEG